jgi:hypothetical protein
VSSLKFGNPLWTFPCGLCVWGLTLAAVVSHRQRMEGHGPG